jgi:hypothetical protein
MQQILDELDKPDISGAIAAARADAGSDMGKIMETIVPIVRPTAQQHSEPTHRRERASETRTASKSMQRTQASLRMPSRRDQRRRLLG